ncbi:MAG: signal recognition particle-docking protein FtsY [Nanoarchaeota archaeon]
MFDLLKKKLKSLFQKDESEKKKKSKSSKKAKNKKEPKSSKKEKPIKSTEPKKAPKVEIIEKKESFFSKLTSRFTSSTITKPQIEELFNELELILLENNVSLEVVDAIKEELIKNLEGKEAKKDQIESKIKEALKDAISSVLREPEDLVSTIKNHQGIYKIIFFGINGSGKTTSLAKLAHYLKKNNISCVLAAGDTFRAASIEQLELHAKKLQVPIIKQTYGSDPAAVAFDAIKHAEKNNIKCVLIDTAGRMYTKENLIREMEKIIRVVKPDLKIFVGESITGNDATEQARIFSEAIGIDGIILTKADVDDKGGTALSVSYITKKPIYFLGLGQNYQDLKPFKKSLILDNLGLN